MLRCRRVGHSSTNAPFHLSLHHTSSPWHLSFLFQQHGSVSERRLSSTLGLRASPVPAKVNSKSSSSRNPVTALVTCRFTHGKASPRPSQLRGEAAVETPKLSLTRRWELYLEVCLPPLRGAFLHPCLRFLPGNIIAHQAAVDCRMTPETVIVALPRVL